MSEIDSIEAMIEQSVRLTSDVEDGINEVSVISTVNLMFGMIFGAVSAIVLYEFVFSSVLANVSTLLKVAMFGIAFYSILTFYKNKSSDVFTRLRIINVTHAWVHRYLIEPVTTPPYAIDPEHILKFNGKKFSTLTEDQRIYLIYLLKNKLVTLQDVFGDNYGKELTDRSKDAIACLKYLNSNTHIITIDGKALKSRVSRLRNAAIRSQNVKK